MGKILFFFSLFLSSFISMNCYHTNDVIDILCPRVFFSTSEDYPYKSVIESIYIKTKFILNDFPVYRNERAEVYFTLYHNYFYFVPSINYGRGNNIRIKADTDYITRYPSSWLFSLSNKTNAFGNVFETTRLQYDTKNGYYDTWSKYYKVKAICVDFSQCQNGKVFFGFPVPLPEVDLSHSYFEQESYFYNNRPVYRYVAPTKDGSSSIGRIKLYHSVGFWVIGTSYPKSAGVRAVQSSALKPEYITEPWKQIENQWSGWTYINAGIQCVRGRSVMCNQCLNGGRCRTDHYRKTFCVCPIGYQGKYCERKSETCKKEVFPNFDNEIGSNATKMCLNWYGRYFKESAICTSTGWSGWSDICRDKPPVNPREKQKSAPINFDKYNPTLKIIIYVVLPVFILFYPFFFHCLGSGKCGIKSWWKIFSLHYYVGMFLWIAYIILYFTMDLEKYGSIFKDLLIFAYVCAPLAHVYVLMEALCSEEAKYLQGAEEGENNVKNYIQGVISQRPVLSIHGEAYHYETRTRTVTYTDANGNLQTRYETYQEKVVTWSGFEIFNFKSWVDVSDIKQFDVLDNVQKAQRLKFSATYTFSDDETRDAFRKVEDDFDKEHERLDTYFLSHWNYSIEGYKEHVLFKDENSSCCMSCCGFCLFSMCFLSWPYRLWLNKSTGEQKFEFEKLISIHENISPEALMQFQRVKALERQFIPNANNIDRSSAPMVAYSSRGAEVTPVVQIQQCQPQAGIPATLRPVDHVPPPQANVYLPPENHAFQPDNSYLPGPTPFPAAPPSYEDAMKAPPLQYDYFVNHK